MELLTIHVTGSCAQNFVNWSGELGAGGGRVRNKALLAAADELGSCGVWEEWIRRVEDRTTRYLVDRKRCA